MGNLNKYATDKNLAIMLFIALLLEFVPVLRELGALSALIVVAVAIILLMR